MSPPHALQYRETALKYLVKKIERHFVLDVLRKVGAKIEGFHAMFASLVSRHDADLRISDGDQSFKYMRNVPSRLPFWMSVQHGGL